MNIAQEMELVRTLAIDFAYLAWIVIGGLIITMFWNERRTKKKLARISGMEI